MKFRVERDALADAVTWAARSLASPHKAVITAHDAVVGIWMALLRQGDEKAILNPR